LRAKFTTPNTQSIGSCTVAPAAGLN
jgi:hypothetical protein